MEDTDIGTVTSAAPTSADTPPTTAAPQHQSPIDQTKDIAKKVLAMITGRTKS